MTTVVVVATVGLNMLEILTKFYSKHLVRLCALHYAHHVASLLHVCNYQQKVGFPYSKMYNVLWQCTIWQYIYFIQTLIYGVNLKSSVYFTEVYMYVS